MSSKFDNFELESGIKDIEENTSDGNTPSSDSSIQNRNPSGFLAIRKAAAQGMMDVALLTANANQLRSLLDFSSKNSTFYVLLILIILSLILQVIVGVLLIFKGHSDFRRRSRFRREKSKLDIRLNDCVNFGVFFIVVDNILIAAFTQMNQKDERAKDDSFEEKL